jgi:putative sugar O-methyltransferase
MKQLNYVQISSSQHPKKDEYTFFKEPVADPDKFDIEIAKEIIKFQKRIGIIDMGGAWKFYNENTRGKYVTALREADFQSLAYLLTNMFQTECTSAIITPSINVAGDHDLCNQMAWDLDACAEFTDGKYPISLLDSAKVGAPFGTEREGVRMSSDSPRHLYFADMVMKNLSSPRDRILEIGGGYGGLIHFLRKIQFEGTYINIDLPETLFVAYYFLKKLGHDVHLVADSSELKEGTINLIPSTSYKEVLNSVKIDLFFNSASLSEMSEKICFDYIRFVNDLGPRSIIHCNTNYLAFPASKIHIEVLSKDFPWDDCYGLTSRYPSPFQGASGRYRIHLLERKSTT